MTRIHQNGLPRGSLDVAFVLAMPLAVACSGNSSNLGIGACATGGTPGPTDDHCSAPDGGTMVQVVDPAACKPAATTADDGGTAAPACVYGGTMYGEQGNDDDCKYHLSWSSTPICKGMVTFTMVATTLSSGMPLTGAAAQIEAFTTTPGDWDSATYCDSRLTHITPTNNGGFIVLTESPPGTYAGSFALDQSGPWTVRFHLFETCSDVPSSPHAHAAFHVRVP